MNIALVTVPTLVVLFIILEVVFRFIVVASDPPRQFMDRENKIMRFDTTGKRDGVSTFGRFGQQQGRWHVNDAGWLSDVEYHTKAERVKPLIAVIGDSYVEALQVDHDKNFVALLREALGDSFDVYAFGLSDTPLSGYLHLARYVDRVYDPDVLIVTLCYNDFDESVRELHFGPNFLQVSVRDSSVVEIQPVPRTYNRLKRFLFHFATMRYLYSLAPNFFHKLNWNTTRPSASNENIAADEVRGNRAVVSRATRYLLETLCRENSARKVYVIMAAPRSDIYRGTLETSSVRWLNDMVADVMKNLPCVLIDQTEFFKNDYLRHGTKFESPYDAHWNEYGHYVTFEQLLGVFRDQRKGLWRY
jgi:lysophospholipase L1-like esterase